jgi:predicted alpha/beta hydrolase family esterase
MKQILFAHSAGPQYGKGKGSYDLVHALRTKLHPECKILFPKIEKPNSPTYAKYKDLFASAFANITEPVILIGHSLGGSTLLKYLSEERPDISIAGLFLVSVPHWTSNMKEFELKKNFQSAIKPVPPVYLYHSKNDPVVPFKHMAFYADAFKSAVTRELRGREHVFEKGLPPLASDIRALLQST